MPSTVLRIVLSCALGLAGALGLSYLVSRSASSGAAAAEPVPVADLGLALDPALTATLEVRYASLSPEELVRELQLLRQQILVLHATLVEQRIAEGEYQELPYEPGMPLVAPTDRVTSGTIQISGPPEARVLRSVLVPQGYDSQMDLLQQEYAWLAEKCGIDPGAVGELASTNG